MDLHSTFSLEVRGLGFSGPVHEETHLCASNISQFNFVKTVQAGCINSVLVHGVHAVPSVYDSVRDKIFPNINVESYFIYAHTQGTRV